MIEEIEKYLEYLSSVQGYSEKTVVSYRHDLSRLDAYMKKYDIKLQDFVFEDARNFASQLYNEGLKSSSINRIISANRSFFHSLLENSIVKVQPFERVSRAKQGRRVPVVLSEDEVNRLLNYDYKNFNEFTEVTMFNLFYSTGARLSEIMGIEPEDIDFANRRIKILGKGNKERFIFLTHSAAEITKEYIKERAEVIKETSSGEKKLLINKKGKQLPLSTVHSIFDKYRVKLGITKKFTPHVFRHTFATRLLDNNSDIRIVQALLGHESIGTTQIYTHVTGARLQKVYNDAHPHSRRNK